MTDNPDGPVYGAFEDFSGLNQESPDSLVVREDFSGSGRVTQVLLGGVLVWTWAWHIDGPPSSDLQSLLDAFPRRENTACLTDGYPSVTNPSEEP